MFSDIHIYFLNFRAILCINNLILHRYVCVLCNHYIITIVVNILTYGQLHTCYTCKRVLSKHKMALKLRNIHVCQKTLFVKKLPVQFNLISYLRLFKYFSKTK